MVMTFRRVMNKGMAKMILPTIRLESVTPTREGRSIYDFLATLAETHQSPWTHLVREAFM